MSPLVPDSAVFGEVSSEVQIVRVPRVISFLKFVLVTASCWMYRGVVPVAPVLSFTMRTKERVPFDVEFETTFTAVPVVSASASPMSSSVPVVTAAPVRSSSTPAASAAEAVTRSTTVSSLAAEANSDKTADVPVAPVWSTRSRRPAPVIAVADEVITAAMPEVRPFAFMRRIPAAVVAELAVSVSRLPVVTKVPDEVISIPAPEVRPFAVMLKTRPVVAELATNATTSVPVKTPELVTVKAVAEVELDVMSPRATTAEPPMVVVDGRTTFAPSPIDTSRLERIPPPYFTFGM